MNNIITCIKVCGVLLAASLIFKSLIRKQDGQWIGGKPLMIMVLAFPFALAVYNIWFLFAGLFLLLPIVARTRGDACALYVVALLALPFMPQNFTIGSASIILIDNYSALSAGLLLCSVIKPGSAPQRKTIMHLPVIVLFALETIGNARGLNSTSIIRTTIQEALSIALPYYAMIRCIDNPQDLRRVLLAFCFAASVQAMLAIYEAERSWPIYESLQRSLGAQIPVSQATKLRAGFMRANGTLPESTGLSWVLMASLAGLVCSRPSFKSGINFGISVCIICLGLVACQARSGWLAAAISIVLIDLFKRNYASAGMKSLSFVIFYYVIDAIQGHYDRLASFAASGADTFNYRVRLFYRGVEEISKHPWFGNDLNTVTAALQDLKQGEGIVDFVNAYIFIALVTGLLGGALFIFQFLYTQLRTFSIRNKILDGKHSLIAAWVFAISGSTMVTAYTSGFGGSVMTFYLVVLAVGSRLNLLFAGVQRPARPNSMQPAPMGPWGGVT